MRQAHRWSGIVQELAYQATPRLESQWQWTAGRRRPIFDMLCLPGYVRQLFSQRIIQCCGNQWRFCAENRLHVATNSLELRQSQISTNTLHAQRFKVLLSCEEL